MVWRITGTSPYSTRMRPDGERQRKRPAARRSGAPRELGLRERLDVLHRLAAQGEREVAEATVRDLVEEAADVRALVLRPHEIGESGEEPGPHEHDPQR